MNTNPEPGTRNRERFIVVVVFLVVWGLITHGTYAGSGDEPHYLIVAQSLAFDGDLDLANNYAMPENLIGAGTLAAEAHAVPGRGGVLRPVHDIGLPLLFAPYVRLVYPLATQAARVVPEPWLRRAKLNGPLIFRHLISMAMALVTGLLAVQLSMIFRRGGAPPWTAAGWALLVALSPPVLSHAFLFFTEIPSALLVTWLFLVLSDAGAPDGALLRADEDPDRRAGPFEPTGEGAPLRRTVRWGIVGLAVGLLLLIHVRNIALVIGFATWASIRLHRRRRPAREWAAFAAALAVPVAIRSAALYTFWGTLVTSPIARPALSMPVGEAAFEALARLAGLLFDRDFGLLLFSPLYVLAVPGLWYLRASRIGGSSALARLVFGYVATLVIPYVNPWGVDGGWAPAARMLVPIVPLLAVAVFSCARAMPPVGRRLVLVLVILQLAIDAIVWQSPKRLWNTSVEPQASKVEHQVALTTA